MEPIEPDPSRTGLGQTEFYLLPHVPVNDAFATALLVGVVAALPIAIGAGAHSRSWSSRTSATVRLPSRHVSSTRHVSSKIPSVEVEGWDCDDSCCAHCGVRQLRWPGGNFNIDFWLRLDDRFVQRKNEHYSQSGGYESLWRHSLHRPLDVAEKARRNDCAILLRHFNWNCIASRAK